jgi:hypothetical protein
MSGKREGMRRERERRERREGEIGTMSGKREGRLLQTEQGRRSRRRVTPSPPMRKRRAGMSASNRIYISARHRAIWDRGM